jgi:hypothetical protein
MLKKSTSTSTSAAASASASACLHLSALGTVWLLLPRPCQPTTPLPSAHQCRLSHSVSRYQPTRRDLLVPWRGSSRRWRRPPVTVRGPINDRTCSLLPRSEERGCVGERPWSAPSYLHPSVTVSLPHPLLHLHNSWPLLLGGRRNGARMLVLSRDAGGCAPSCSIRGRI